MIISELGTGGAETAFLRLANYLSGEMDVKIALMTHGYGSANYAAAILQTNLPIILLDELTQVHANIFSKLTRWFRMRSKLKRLKDSHDVTISFMSGANLLNGLTGNCKGTIVSERGPKRFDTYMSPRKRFIWTRILDPLAYRGSRFVVAASEGVAQEIALANPRFSTRVRAVEGTVHTSRLMQLVGAKCESEFDAFKQRPTVIAFGRLHHAKGFDALIAIFARVHARLPEARLLLIGDGPDKDLLLLQAHANGLRAGEMIEPARLDVVFAGYRHDPVRYLKLAKVFAFTSRYEGLPNALIEALASGVPLLAADCPWGPRSVLRGLSDMEVLSTGLLPLQMAYGTLMPLPDTHEGAAAWEDALLSALQNPQPRREPEVCRAAVARFDIEETGKAWVALIEQAIREAEQGKR